MPNPSESLSSVLTDAVSSIQRRQPNQNGTNNPQVINDVHKWRNILSFWILGLCNNYGYVVMLSAAFDIIKRFNGSSDNHFTDALALAISRDCIIMSTGVLLLADTIPSLCISFIAPFMPFYINVRLVLACSLSATGFIVVALAQHEWQAMLGIVFTSFSSGLGETSMLAYTAKFNRNVISGWASGTGAAGVAGSLSYAALINIGFTPKHTLLLMLFVPLIQLIIFCFILVEPNRIWSNISNASSTTSLIDHTIDHDVSISQPPLSVSQKLQFAPKMLKYVLPLFAVYVCEYFINQGLLDVIYFPNIWIDHSAQYRWLQATYQVGVFVSRSSLSLFSTNQLWMMSILQFVNVVYFTVQAIFMTVPTIWVVFIIVFWEGLLGSCCYVNTFNRISKELTIQYRSFGMGLTTIGQSCGVVLAGLLAFPIHKVNSITIIFTHEIPNSVKFIHKCDSKIYTLILYTFTTIELNVQLWHYQLENNLFLL